MKRLYTGKELENLKVSLDPNRAKSDDDSDDDSDKKTKKGNSGTVKSENVKQSPQDKPESSTSNLDIKSPDKSSPSVFQEPRSVSEVSVDKHSSLETQIKSPVTKVAESKDSNDIITSANEAKRASRSTSPKLASPLAQSKPDSSSTPRSEPAKADLGSPHFSPVQKPDSQVPNSPDVQSEQVKSNSSWNLFKRTPTYKSEASPINRLESHSKIKHAKVIEQCSPTTSLENKPSPETLGLKPDIKNPNSWNYGNYSPMPRQDNQFSSQRSPYSAQPSPAQPSPYSQTQPSPYSTQPSPYSSQPSPYSAQPSPDTSQIIKPDLPKSGAWNTGNYSPLPKHHAPFSPHPSTHTSPDPGLAVKGDNLRSSSTKTPGQYSPMSRHHQSPYSPRPSVDNSYSNKKSPGVGKRSPLVRPDCHLPSPDGGHGTRHSAGRTQDMYNRSISKAPEVIQNVPPPDLPTSWGLDRYNQLNTPTTGIESLVWGSEHFGADPMTPHIDNIPSMLNTAPPTRSQPWNDVSHFDTGGRRPNDVSDPWTLGQFRIEPPHQMHNTFVEQNISFESLSSHVSHQQVLPSFLDDGFTETSRGD
ncbi:AT-rich interactive domain-containing protein 1A-like isoform X2 [Leptidea sinapis]|nr:AT-rich interactive domain-containing protein 1A-like isoform X2 [Leptidea sinapis]XP_050665301.1 AT-rich interactive domain-containing protein 1A-like isoform X2 [Leptidea sinapis]XP_050665302.1 AT-rich interactive domain-containing protein 1A-like isoform X2 [Leptidea sinapis]XP_050665303.1 AT-rich interactive domain-containing protein 1A-like isoform X2 [Leptidea sinapis]